MAAARPAAAVPSKPVNPAPALAPAGTAKAGTEALRRPGVAHATTADDGDWESF